MDTLLETLQIAVIGAGPLGSATARHLAEAGHAVTVFGPDEPASFQGHRGTWSGHYDQGRMAVTDPLVVATELGHRSMARYDDLERRSGVTFTKAHPQLMMFPDGASQEARLSRSEGHAYRMLEAVLANSRDRVMPEVLAGEELRTSRREAVATSREMLGRSDADESELWAWLQSLNALRLVLGTLLGIEDDDDHEADVEDDDPAAAVWNLYDLSTAGQYVLVRPLGG